MRRLLPLLLLAACSSNGDQPDTTPAGPSEPGEDAISRVSENGPIKAVVTVWPPKPQLGDPINLRLEVTAKPGVTVEMPQFGEALGRFSIVRFTPRLDRGADGTSASQTYVLDPPMSGAQRIPPLRIEYVDQRPSPDANSGEARELLTEEIAVQVESVVTDSELTAELEPARGRLQPQLHASGWAWWLPWALGGLLLVGGGIALVLWRRRRPTEAAIDPYELATGRLAVLEAGGLPDAAAVDGWYVELSAIVRHYIEDRFGIRAPELTTEEFLPRAAGALEADHRALLSSFLEGCDRVKFAGHRPDDDESQAALTAARRFLDDTRPGGHDGGEKEVAASAA